MVIKLFGKPDVDLPSGMTVEERVRFCEELIAENPISFTMTDHAVADHKVSVRLDILGTWILKGDENKDNSIMSRYKEVRRPYQEKSMSCLFEGQKEQIENLLYGVAV